MIAALAAIVLLQAPHNTLTPEESRAGWRLLFDGKTTKGWKNFKSEGIGSGWQVKDGALVCADPSKAGDIITEESFDWFELSIDFNLTPGGNSGIMFHVQEKGDAAWHSGPEVQLFDHGTYRNPQKTGWLYDLYRTDIDTTKPAGEWNTIRLLVTPKKSETFVNGTKYYEFVLGSEDFKSRVAKSKFAKMPFFAQVPRGSIALQGDHGVVSFRNIKVRRVRP